LVAENLIDELQQFDMNDMANAAYWHAVEELQTYANGWLLRRLILRCFATGKH
jgi:hypothetical protein